MISKIAQHGRRYRRGDGWVHDRDFVDNVVLAT